MGSIKAFVSAQWTKLPLPWKLWIKGLVLAVGTGLAVDVGQPLVEAFLAGQPVQFHGLDRKVWVMSIGLAWAYRKTHPLPAWDGVDRRTAAEPAAGKDS